MRYWVYDEDGVLMRKFYSHEEAKAFMQPHWEIKVLPKIKPVLPTPETHGEARW